jgi:hypothetical protein
MLLRCDYDHARSRAHLFADCQAFAKKLVLTRRIVWFDGPRAAPSFNHAWYLWNQQHSGPPTLAYAKGALRRLPMRYSGLGATCLPLPAENEYGGRYGQEPENV